METTGSRQARRPFGAGGWRGAALGASAALVLAGCDGGEGIADPGTMLAADEAAELAEALSGQGEDAVSSEDQAAEDRTASATVLAGGSSGVRQDEVGFRRRRDCPGGGEVRVRGTVLHTFDPETRTRTLELEADKVHRDCGLRIRGHRLRLTGDPGLRLKADRKRVEGVLSGPQTATLRGAVAVEGADGRAGTCRVDLSWTVLPEEGSRTLEGRVCGHEVSRTVDRASGA